MSGYPQEMQDFMECVDQNREPKCGAALAQDTVAVMYAAYVSAERRGADVGKLAWKPYRKRHQ